MSISVTPYPTKLLHLTYDGNFQLDCEAKLLDCKFVEGEEEKSDEIKVEIQLDSTTMYPQGKEENFMNKI